jgi:hypothetical protein
LTKKLFRNSKFVLRRFRKKEKTVFNKKKKKIIHLETSKFKKISNNHATYILGSKKINVKESKEEKEKTLISECIQEQ